MSTNELSEMIAMGCPDLGSTPNSNGGSASGSSTQIHIYDEKRRLSVKQMTATELAAVRAAAALDIKNALALKVSEPVKIATSAPATPLMKPNSLNFSKESKALQTVSAPSTPLAGTALMTKPPEIVMEYADSNNSSAVQSYQGSRSPSPGEAHLDAKVKLLPSSPAPRDRITSLPSILDEGMEDHFLSLKDRNSRNSDVSEDEHKRSNNQLTASNNSLLQQSSDESISPKSLNDRNYIMDSIELMRKQRSDRNNSRERRSDSLLDDRLLHHDRSAAPDRMHSSSISSISSAAGGGSSSVTLPLNPSKNTSRRNSNSSIVSDVSTSATVVLPPTPPIYPLSKTSSAPNMERRRSSLSTLFPGPSPLVAPEPVLHTVPKGEQEEVKKVEIPDIVQDVMEREIPTGKQVHRTKTPPPVGVKLGVNLKKVTPPRTQITVKKNEGPMLGVVLRKVEKKPVPQKSILEDDKPLYHISIVRSDGKEHKPSEHQHHSTSKPKPKPVPLQKSATIAAKPNPGGILTGPQTSTTKATYPVPQVPGKPQRPVPGVPITIQKIEGDKIIIIKKYIVPKNSKLPEHLVKVGVRILCPCSLSSVLSQMVCCELVHISFCVFIFDVCFCCQSLKKIYIVFNVFVRFL